MQTVAVEDSEFFLVMEVLALRYIFIVRHSMKSKCAWHIEFFELYSEPWLGN